MYRNKMILAAIVVVGATSCTKKNGTSHGEVATPHTEKDNSTKSSAASEAKAITEAKEPAPDTKGVEESPKDGTKVELTTSKGKITLQLFDTQAPKSVASFLAYVKSGYYAGTIFHRVIDNFMIQGGGYTSTFQKKTTNDPVMNEADNGLKNDRGTVALARTMDPHSATAQFFINVKDNGFLNHTAKTTSGWGYAVFGKVIDGMDVVDAIKSVPTGAKGPFMKDVPQETITIDSAKVIE